MIVAIGIDIIEISRLENTFARRGQRFRDRVFTVAEIEYCQGSHSRIASFAVRFAAKEATMKALGSGWAAGVGWRDIEVVRGPAGPPSLVLTGRALKMFDDLGATRSHLSLSHSSDLAIAQVIFES